MTTNKVIEGIVEPGDLARCKVTKLEGIVVVRHDYLYGMSRLGIQPEGSFEGKEHAIIDLDLAQADLLVKQVVSRDGLVVANTVELGDKCRDSISGFEGVCVSLATWLYACSKACLAPQKILPKTQQPVEPCWFDAQQVAVVKVAEVPVEKKDSKTTGGFDKPTSSRSSVKSARRGIYSSQPGGY